MSDKLETALYKKTLKKKASAPEVDRTKEHEAIADLQWARDPHRMSENPFKPGSNKFADDTIKRLRDMKQKELQGPGLERLNLKPKVK